MKESSSAITCQKILDAATDIFGELGYQVVTVRDIVKRAGVNQAAINYHFRSKDALYAKAVKQALSKTSFLDDITLKLKPLPPDKKLYAFMRRIVETLYNPSGHSCRFSRLVARELAEPSGISDYTVECDAFIYDIMRQVFPPQTPQIHIKISTLWFLAQSSVIGHAIQKAARERGTPIPNIEYDFDFCFALLCRGLLMRPNNQS